MLRCATSKVISINPYTQALPDQTVSPCPIELEDARWFSREEVEEAKHRIDANPKLRYQPHVNLAMMNPSGWGNLGGGRLRLQCS